MQLKPELSFNPFWLDSDPHSNLWYVMIQDPANRNDFLVVHQSNFQECEMLKDALNNLSAKYLQFWRQQNNEL